MPWLFYNRPQGPFQKENSCQATSEIGWEHLPGRLKEQNGFSLGLGRVLP